MTSLWAAALWGLAEGTFFFVVPDLLFTWTTLFSPKRGLLQLGAAVVGALVAGTAMYAWAATAPVQARAAVAAVPFVGEKMIGPAERRWDEEGTRALFNRPLGGVPYKVHAVLAPAAYVDGGVPARERADARRTDDAVLDRLRAGGLADRARR